MTKAERLQLRLTADHQGLIEQAAQIEGTTMTSYVTRHLVLAAERTIQEQHILKLHQEQALSFLRDLEALEEGELSAGARDLQSNFGKVQLPVGISLDR